MPLTLLDLLEGKNRGLCAGAHRTDIQVTITQMMQHIEKSTPYCFDGHVGVDALDVAHWG